MTTTSAATKRATIKTGQLEGPKHEMPAVIRDARPQFYSVYSPKIGKDVWIRPCPKCNATGTIKQTFRKTSEVAVKKCFACAIPGHPEINTGKGYQTVADYERNQRYTAFRQEAAQHYATGVKESLLNLGIPEDAFRQPVVAPSDDDGSWEGLVG